MLASSSCLELIWAISHPLFIQRGSKELVYLPVPWSSPRSLALLSSSCLQVIIPPLEVPHPSHSEYTLPFWLSPPYKLKNSLHGWNLPADHPPLHQSFHKAILPPNQDGSLAVYFWSPTFLYMHATVTHVQREPIHLLFTSYFWVIFLSPLFKSGTLSFISTCLKLLSTSFIGFKEHVLSMFVQPAINLFGSETIHLFKGLANPLFDKLF